MRWRCVHVDEVRRFSLEMEEESRRTFVAIPVRNHIAEYLEWYEVDAPTFWDYRDRQGGGGLTKGRRSSDR